MQVRDRIKELRRVPASELIPNPKNWRLHPSEQQAALTGVLAEVGYADALLARETPDGLMLVDGHLRAETTPDADVPVLVLDITEREADLMLATLDPLAAMAEVNEVALTALLETVSTTNADLASMLDYVEKGAAPGFEPNGMWDPRLATQTLEATDEPIKSTITVTCPIHLADQVRQAVTDAMDSYDEVTVA
jgi:hypothetical protein